MFKLGPYTVYSSRSVLAKVGRIGVIMQAVSDIQERLAIIHREYTLLPIVTVSYFF